MKKRAVDTTEEVSAQSEKPRKVNLQVLLDEELVRAVRAQCGHKGLRVGDAVTTALREWLKTMPPVRLGATS